MGAAREAPCFECPPYAMVDGVSAQLLCIGSFQAHQRHDAGQTRLILGGAQSNEPFSLSALALVAAAVGHHVHCLGRLISGADGLAFQQMCRSFGVHTPFLVDDECREQIECDELERAQALVYLSDFIVVDGSVTPALHERLVQLTRFYKTELFHTYQSHQSKALTTYLGIPDELTASELLIPTTG